MKFMNKLRNFMSGRYIIYDELYKFTLIVYLVLFVINLFFNNKILSLIELLLICYLFFRMFSKNIYKRNLENKKFIEFKNKLFKKRDKYHIYRKCHKCKTILKLPLPNKIGVKHVKCPTCNYRNKYIILRKERIEVIKKK